LTLGEAGTHGTPEQRREEVKAAAKYAGSDIEILDFKDNHIEDTVDNAKIIAKIIRKYAPKIIFAPYHTNKGQHLEGMSHPDHTSLGSIALKAARFAKFVNADIEGKAHKVEKIIYYMVPNFMQPTFLINISDIIPDLKNLWSKHKSQLEARQGKIEELLLTSRRHLGNINYTTYAEGFLTDTIKMDVEDILDI
jgi:LmbE family N-acetylglucosaminyl deacetylase